ncbi:hypothetical protein DFH27DRAFT_137855 [Peziza echinospora]|nr:hypothetical protein DFH27DRAFT_137855 [Peziza echinospora]
MLSCWPDVGLLPLWGGKEDLVIIYPPPIPGLGLDRGRDSLSHSFLEPATAGRQPTSQRTRLCLCPDHPALGPARQACQAKLIGGIRPYQVKGNSTGCCGEDGSSLASRTRTLLVRSLTHAAHARPPARWPSPSGPPQHIRPPPPALRQSTPSPLPAGQPASLPLTTATPSPTPIDEKPPLPQTPRCPVAAPRRRPRPEPRAGHCHPICPDPLAAQSARLLHWSHSGASSRHELRDCTISPVPCTYTHTHTHSHTRQTPSPLPSPPRPPPALSESWSAPPRFYPQPPSGLGQPPPPLRFHRPFPLIHDTRFWQES